MDTNVFTIMVVLLLAWPLLHVAISNRARGGAQLGWFVLTLVFSWLAYAVFLITTQRPASHEAVNLKRAR